MELQSINKILGYELVVENRENKNISEAYTSDLLSDVMGHAKEASVLITVQAHKNTIAVATIADIRAIILCNNRQAPADMIKAAEEESIAIFQTEDSQFDVSWKIKNLMDRE